MCVSFLLSHSVFLCSVCCLPFVCLVTCFLNSSGPQKALTYICCLPAGYANVVRDCTGLHWVESWDLVDLDFHFGCWGHYS